MGVYTGHCTSLPSICLPPMELQQHLGAVDSSQGWADWSKDTIPPVGDGFWMSVQPDLAMKLEGNVR